MKQLNKIAMLLAVCCSAVLVAGCDDDERKAVYEMHERAWQACIANGGVPTGSWFNERVLSDCIYKPVGN
jgi:hypothetical protein